MKRVKVIVSLLIVFFIVVFLFYPLPSLVLSKSDGKIVLILPLIKGKNFSYEYLHSVQKTPVQEHFVQAPGNIILLTSTSYQSFGVGLPFLSGEGDFALKNGIFVLKNMNRKYEKITWAFMPVARQALIYKDKRYPFYKYCRPGELLELEIQNLNGASILVKSWQARKGVFDK
ncbi:DUF1850 domain-containing protein [Thermosyntropha sp.]|uniref:DUF1850 domain-containing protein n=1 Tax=Thermosyntropha sp. TaxID=2740820 RepID=UPI0025DF56D4|nr:DUF1850 domain-containing protein [Thermosyntropha sp.]MBO8159903.1 DUF1850 domain-containing protein [Thermosyntropha sp.]